MCLLVLAQAGGFAHASDRVALLIANKDYQRSPLKNPVNDALLIEKKLKQQHFDVTVVKNADRVAMLEAINAFGRKAERADSAVFYYSGHGMQDDSRVNYLLPVNAKIRSEASIKAYGVEAYDVVSALNKAKPRVGLVIFDACRDNPFAGVRGSKNFAVMPYEAKTEMLVSYATKTGQYAKDGRGKNSPYAIALAEQLDNASTTPLLLMFDHVSERVKALTNHEQSPTRMGDAKVSTFLVPSSQPANLYTRPSRTTAPSIPANNAVYSVSTSDIMQWRELRQFNGHTETIRSVAFSPDGRLVLSGGKTMRLYDTRSGQFIREFTGYKDGVNSVAFSPDGRFLLSGNSDRTMRLWGLP